jgi:hypothetical protein
MKTVDKKYVLLQGPYSNRFISFNEPGKDYSTVDCKVIGYAGSIDEAQIKLYGRTFPLPGVPRD